MNKMNNFLLKVLNWNSENAEGVLIGAGALRRMTTVKCFSLSQFYPSQYHSFLKIGWYVHPIKKYKNQTRRSITILKCVTILFELFVLGQVRLEVFEA